MGWQASFCKLWEDVSDKMGGPSLVGPLLGWRVGTEGPRMENGTPPFSQPCLLTHPAHLRNPFPKINHLKWFVAKILIYGYTGCEIDNIYEHNVFFVESWTREHVGVFALYKALFAGINPHPPALL